MASGYVISTLGTSYAFSNSCADVSGGIAQWLFVNGGAVGGGVYCSTDPVIAGGTLKVGSGWHAVSVITATSASESTPYRAMADDYAAVSMIFGAVLVAACCIWGAKQVLRMFRDRGEE